MRDCVVPALHWQAETTAEGGGASAANLEDDAVSSDKEAALAEDIAVHKVAVVAVQDAALCCLENLCQRVFWDGAKAFLRVLVGMLALVGVAIFWLKPYLQQFFLPLKEVVHGTDCGWCDWCSWCGWCGWCKSEGLSLVWEGANKNVLGSERRPTAPLPKWWNGEKGAGGSVVCRFA